MSKFDKSYLKIHEICRPGRDFVFQIGIDRSRLDVLAQRVTEAFRRFQSMPIVAGVANELEEIMLVSSIHGTNKVEGGLLSEAEVKQIIEHDASVISSDNEKRRVLNLKNAYDYAENTIENYQHHLNDGSNSLLSSLSLAATPITEKHIFNLHRLAMAGLMPKDETW